MFPSDSECTKVIGVNRGNVISEPLTCDAPDHLQSSSHVTGQTRSNQASSEIQVMCQYSKIIYFQNRIIFTKGLNYIFIPLLHFIYWWNQFWLKKTIFDAHYKLWNFLIFPWMIASSAMKLATMADLNLWPTISSAWMAMKWHLRTISRTVYEIRIENSTCSNLCSKYSVRSQICMTV